LQISLGFVNLTICEGYWSLGCLGEVTQVSLNGKNLSRAIFFPNPKVFSTGD